MIVRYQVLVETVRAALKKLEQVVERTEGALPRAEEQEEDRDYFFSAAALDLHGFYVGVERLFQRIATEVDGTVPSGARWHRDLLDQMTLKVTGVRPAVILPETYNALTTYLEFRHVVQRVYTFELRSERVIELVRGLHSTFNLVQRDLLAFTEFLESLVDADAASE